MNYSGTPVGLSCPTTIHMNDTLSTIIHHDGYFFRPLYDLLKFQYRIKIHIFVVLLLLLMFDSLFILFPLIVRDIFGPRFVMQYLMSYLVFNHLAE